MYLSFPVGFVILALFSIEMTIKSILEAKKIDKERN
jgi:TRAP-type C4-dicarboxylate transport system permease small subunit